MLDKNMPSHTKFVDLHQRCNCNLYFDPCFIITKEAKTILQQYLLHKNVVIPLKCGLHIEFTFQIANAIFSLQTLSTTSFTTFLIHTKERLVRKFYRNRMDSATLKLCCMTWRVRMLCQVNVALNALETTWIVLFDSGVLVTNNVFK